MTMVAKRIDVSAFLDSDIFRFWSKVDFSNGPDSCWPWTGGVDKDGYGKFQLQGPSGQISLRANRVALALSRGIDNGLALHECDNPPCCNPNHLWSGSQKNNREDCARKGRAAAGDANGARLHPETRLRGERHPLGQLSVELVFEIRRRRALGEKVSAIARNLGLNRQPVRGVVDGSTWRHI